MLFLKYLSQGKHQYDIRHCRKGRRQYIDLDRFGRVEKVPHDHISIGFILWIEKTCQSLAELRIVLTRPC